jgi:tetratricopeptide (TPR) repeat protein/NAD-dependent SIR2 family protein deacetylase
MSIRRRIKVETRDRRDVLAEAVITQDQFLSEFFANPLKHQFLFGAGMSVSAGIPLTRQIIDEIVVKVFEKTNPAKRGQVNAEELKEWVSREKWFNPNYAYISALEKEYPSAYLRTELFKRYMKGRFPTPAQLLHAIGVKEGKLNNRCYTTNWDTLTEDAFYWLRGTNCVTIKDPGQLREVKDEDHRYVIKLHGDFDRYDVRYLREGMARHNDDMKEFLQQSLSGVALVVLGYSGNEYSVMNMLMELAHEHEDVLSGGLYWGYIGNLKMIPEPITDLIAVGLEKGKNFRIFEMDEADFLFERISRELKLESIENELSVAFFRFNKMPYGQLRGRQELFTPALKDLVHRDLLDEGFLVRDYNLIMENWKEDTKGFMKKKEEKERAAREAERKLVNHTFNDLKHENYADAEVKLRGMLQHFAENELVHWGLAWAHYSTGRYEEALQHFDRALALKGDNWATYIAKAMCYHNMGNYAQEIAHYDLALQHRPELDFALYNRGLAAHALGDKALEKSSYEAAVAANGGNYLAWYHLGLVLAEEGSQLSAMRAFARAKEINAKLFNALYNNGLLLGKMGQDMQAIVHFDACITLNQADDESFKQRGVAEVMTSQYEHAVESYEEYLHAHENDPESWANISVALRGVHRLDEAMDYCDKYIAKNPGDARAWYNKGLILYDQGDKQAAMEAWDKSLSLNNDFDMVWYRKALVLGELGQYEGEIEFLTRFLNRNEQDLRGWFELGEANRKLGLVATDQGAQQRYYGAAVVAYDRALNIQRTDVLTWLMKTTCLNYLHRYTEALECIEFLERYDKQNAEVFFQKGVAQDGLGDQLASADSFAKTLKVDENHAGAYYRRGILLAELEQYAKAVDHFEHVLELTPDDWRAQFYKGTCITKQKEYEKAIGVFEEGLQKWPDKARFVVGIAMAYVYLRKMDDARVALRSALQLDPSLRAEIQATPEFTGMLVTS